MSVTSRFDQTSRRIDEDFIFFPSKQSVWFDQYRPNFLDDCRTEHWVAIDWYGEYDDNPNPNQCCDCKPNVREAKLCGCYEDYCACDDQYSCDCCGFLGFHLTTSDLENIITYCAVCDQRHCPECRTSGICSLNPVPLMKWHMTISLQLDENDLLIDLTNSRTKMVRLASELTDMSVLPIEFDFTVERCIATFKDLGESSIPIEVD